MPPRRLRRLPRTDAYIGRNRYFVTIRVWDKQPAFTNAQLVETCRVQIAAACLASGFISLVECYMPDHLHLLLEGITGTADLRKCMKDAKQRTGYYARKLGIGRLWQSGYYERILRQDDSLSRYADYIINNPVKAGLVAKASEYPHVFDHSTRKPDLQVGRTQRLG
jgi:REP-associated tyrosine transposase